MIEASSYFILFEFFRRFDTSFQFTSVGLFDLFIWGGTTLLVLSFAILLKRSPGKTARTLYTGTIIFLFILCTIFVVKLLIFSHVFFEQWFLYSLGLEPSLFYTYTFLFLFGVSSFTTGVVSRFMPEKPNNDSTLNKRQVLQSCAAITATITLGIALWNWTHEIFSAISIAILLITELLCLFIWFYDVFIFIVSKILPAKTKTIKDPTPGRINRFAMIICAHNEEKVIGALIESLFSMNYPRAKFDVIVVCDNCTDSTASIAHDKGAITMERNDLNRKGKNEALKWVFSILQSGERQGDSYDAYVTLSADNLVNDQYLNEINEHLNQGHEVMQSYIGSKNPHDTVTAKCASIEFWLGNAHYQEARTRLNLSAQARGTGLVIRPSIFQDVSWEVDSLTGELDFSTRCLLKKNVPCHWVHTARLYAEQPLTLKTSLNQRTRWMQGHMSTMMKYGPRLIGSAIKNLSIKRLDAAFNLMRPLFVLITLIVYLSRWILMSIFPNSIAGISFIMNFEIALVLALAYCLIQTYVLSSESSLRYVIWLPVYYIFSFTWALPIFRGFIKRHERFWVFTFHARNLSINDISEDIHLNEARRRLVGLENLHTLPLGQILLKAAIITGGQLHQALDIQKKNGGYLGNILLEIGAISGETLATYINIQQVFRESAYYDQSEFHTVQLGDVLVDAGLITREQLSIALIHQKEHNCKIGESIVSLHMLSPEVLSIFIEVQNIIGANYLDERKARKFIRDMTHVTTPQPGDVDSFIVNSGLVSKQQLNTARIFGDTHDKTLFDSLLYLGYVSPETLEAIESAINTSDRKSMTSSLDKKGSV